MTIKPKPKNSKLSIAIAAVFVIAGQAAWAESMSLKSAAQKAVLTNPEVLARYHALKAADGELEAVTSPMLPHIDYIASRGRQRLNEPSALGEFSERSRSLQLTQLLWDGLGSWYQKRQFDHARLVRLFEFFDASEEAALEVSRAYYDVLRYRRLVELAEDNYVQHRSVFEQIEAKVKAGVGRRVDFEQASGRLALAESNLIVEISNLHDVSARFQRLVGEPPAEQLETPALIGGLPASIRDGLMTAYAHNGQVRAAVENVRATAYARDSRRGAYQPRVELRLRDDKGRDLSGLTGQTHNQTAEVVLNFNIFNGFGDVGRVDQAVEQYNVARDQRDKACRDVRQTLEIAYNDTRKLTEQRTYLEQHRLSVEKARDAYRKQFDIGQRSLLDLLDTENELFQARRAEVGAEYDLTTAHARVHAGEGKLLSAIGLTSADNALLDEVKDWKAGEEAPEQCPPEPVVTYTADKGKLDERAAEMTQERVKVMLDAIAERKALLDASVSIVPAESLTPVGKTLIQRLAVWSKAWASRDVPAYLAFYAPTFVPANGQSRSAWADNRSKTIGKAVDIKLELSDQKVVALDTTHATTQFHQSYTTATYSDETEKTLNWALIDGQWLIVGETGTAAKKQKETDK